MRSSGLTLLVTRARAVRIDPYVWLAIAFSLFVAMPLAGPGYFFGAHDGPHSVFFLTEFDAALRDGVWYPGWGTDHAFGYGYPTFVLYSPLAYYVAEGFHLLGASKVEAVKWTWALATVGAGLSMYAFGRHILGRQRGLLAAVAYVYAPYHLVDIYVRAALLEYCAFVWMPLSLLAFHLLAERTSARRIAAAGLAYGALWMTHNVSALIFTPLLAAYALLCLLSRTPGVLEPEAVDSGGQARLGQAGWFKDRWGRTVAALGSALLGLGIAGALILPNLFERTNVNQQQWVGATYDYARNFVYPFQLLSPFWGYGAAGPGPVDGMSYQLGTVSLILAAVATLGSLRRHAPERRQVLFFATASALAVWAMLPSSAPAWALLPIASLVQFPWRLLSLTSVTLAVLGGMALPRALRSADYALTLVLALLVLLGSFPYTLPQYTPVPETAEGPLLLYQFETEYPDMVPLTKWATEQPTTSPMVEQYRAGAPLVTAEALAPASSVEMIRAGGASDELWVRSPEGTVLRFYTYYYPGWRVYVDGERLPEAALRPETEYGLLTVDIPAGEHRVLLRWGDTPLRAVGKATTVASLALALLLLLGKKRRLWYNRWR